jgi:hypothetical protein
VIDLSDLNPVPRDRVDGWAVSPEGLDTRSRAELGDPARPARRRRLPAVAVAAIVVLALVASVLVLQRSGSHETAPRARSLVDRLAHGKWKALFDAGLTNAQSVWTGHELIVWGEYAGKVSQGVAYNPRTQKVRPLPSWPLGLQRGALVRWTGTEMLVLGGSDPAASSVAPFNGGVAYNPATHAWRRVAFGPVPFGTATWTGHELLVTSAPSQRSAAASYDPTTDSWKVLPEPPIVLTQAAVAAASNGRQVVFVVGSPVNGWGTMAYDPEAESWQLLLPPPSTGKSNTMDLVRSRSGVTQIGWISEPGLTGRLGAFALPRDFAQGWESVGDPLAQRSICAARATSVRGGAAVWCSSDQLVGLDLASGTWRQFPLPARRPGGIVFTSLAWTGHELVGVADDLVTALVPAAR